MLSACMLVAASCQAPVPKASDWITTGTDCSVFACADLDGDGFGDVLTVNGAHDLCVARAVRGEKSSRWDVLLHDMPADVVGIALIDTDARGSRELVVATPQRLLLWHVDKSGGIDAAAHDFSAALGADPARVAQCTPIAEVSGADGLLWIRTTRDEWMRRPRTGGKLEGPLPRDVTPALAVDPPPYEPAAIPIGTFRGDLNGDQRPDTFTVFRATTPYAHHVVRVALAPAEGSGDLDSDGLSDDDERRLGTDPLDRDTDDDGLLDGWEVHGLPCAMRDLDTPLDPRHQDVIVFVSRYAQLEEAATKNELERAKRIYAEMANTNPDGTRGVRLHFVFGPPVPPEKQGNWPEVGERELPIDCRGIMHWMQVTPGGGGQSAETSDKGGSGLHHAAFAHEVGHQLGLSHTGDSAPAWCPFYPSIMNYAFNYSFDGDGAKTRFSDGSLRDLVLDERALHERLPVAFEKVRYLQKGPFHFTVEARGENSTWIDWNHDGIENEGTVSADVNYGGSTYGGTRRDIGFTASGPALALVDGKITLACVDRASGLVNLRTYLGEERWSDPRVVPDSASDSEPVLTSAGREGLLLVKHDQHWRGVRFDSEKIGALSTFDPDLAGDVSACGFDDHTLVFRVAAAGRAQVWRVEGPPEGGSLRLAAETELEFASGVPLGVAQDPKTRELVVAGSAPNADGKERCFHVAWFVPQADGSFVKRAERIVGGDHGVVHCTTRPVVRFTPSGQLVLFHTGWLDANGMTTAWRTTEVANKALNDGWLVCLMYDIWTQTSVPVAFETDGVNAVYSYRWDASADRKNMLQVAHDGLGIDRAPMRDFDDAALISRWGIRHSILCLRR